MKLPILFFSMLALLSSCNRTSTHRLNLWYKNDSVYVINFADQRLVVNPNGGRITSFQIKNQEILGEGGSTFWLSPQSLWSWPPIAEHHEMNYTSVTKGDTLILKSKPDSILGAVIYKHIYPNVSDSSFTVSYRILNTTKHPIRVAPWENTRTFKEALIFFPAGTTDSTASNPIFGKLLLTKSHDMNWFQFDSSRIVGKEMGKLFADGSGGWIAEVYNRKILIKQFIDISLSQTAPQEGEIEIYADKSNPFCEMEQQGAYKEIIPGNILQWDVKWILRDVPDSIEVKEENIELVDFVKREVK